MSNPQNIDPQVWAIMCRQGCSRESAEQQLLAEQNLQTYAQTTRNLSLRERAEQLLEQIISDHETSESDIQDYKEQLLDAITELEERKRNAQSEIEGVKLEIIGSLKELFEHQDKVWNEKLSLVNQLLGTLKQTQVQLELETKMYNEQYNEYVELTKRANDEVNKYNAMVHELFSRFQRHD